MLIVFDLDFTLWNAGGVWCDLTTPPYSIKNGKIYDAECRHIKLYNDVKEILKSLKEQNISIAIASRTNEPGIAKELLKKFEIEHLISEFEIYPSSKIAHFKQLTRKTQIPYNEMYFFDDEHRNIEEVSKLGVNCTYVRNGINKQIVSLATGIILN